MAMKFEDVEVWRVARALVCAIYGVTGRGGFFRDACLRDVVRQGAVSILANLGQVLEAGGPNGGNEMESDLVVEVLSACTRLRSILIVAADQDYLSDVEVHGLCGQVQGLRDGVAQLFAAAGSDSAAAPPLPVLYNGEVAGEW